MSVDSRFALASASLALDADDFLLSLNDLMEERKDWAVPVGLPLVGSRGKPAKPRGMLVWLMMRFLVGGLIDLYSPSLRVASAMPKLEGPGVRVFFRGRLRV